MIRIVKQQRPINLDLSTFSYPPMAIASILHRISGIVMFLLLPLILYYLSLSLKSGHSFLQFQQMLQNPYVKSVLWIFTSASLYHAIAGIKHIVMDFGYGETLQAARIGAMLVVALGIILTIIVGFWIW